MSIYNVNGIELNECCDLSANELDTAYSLSGNVVYQKVDPYIQGRLLLFEDNFDGVALDDDNWEPEVGYMRGSHLHTADDIIVNNGVLIVKSTRSNRSTSGWTQGSILGCGRQAWMYGRFEAKIRTDGKLGAFPAFWCVGDCYPTTRERKTLEDGTTMEFQMQTEGDSGSVLWPMSGEIDIVEIFSDSVTLGQRIGPAATLWDYFGSSLGGSAPDNSIDVTKWHIYAMEWTPEYIEMFIDGNSIKKWEFQDYDYNRVQAYLTYPQSILLSQGSQGRGTGGESAPTTMEHWMKVDWVRVYAPENITEIIPVESISMVSTFRLKKGYRKYMYPTIAPLIASNHHLTWTSSDESVLQVAHGMMYGIDLGTAILTATSDNGKKAICEVTVVNTL